MATKLFRITISGTGHEKTYAQKQYTFQLCQADTLFPKLKERNGLFVFAEGVQFTFKDMPQIPQLFDGKEQESPVFRWFECPVEVIDPRGRKLRGMYHGSFSKVDGKYIFESVDFSVKL